MSNYDPEKSGELNGLPLEQTQLVVARGSGELAVLTTGHEAVGEEDYIEVLDQGLVGEGAHYKDNYNYDLYSTDGPQVAEIRCSIAKRLVDASRADVGQRDVLTPAIVKLAEELNSTEDNVDFKQQELLIMLRMNTETVTLEKDFERVDLLIEAGQAGLLADVEPIYSIYGPNSGLIAEGAVRRGLDSSFDQSPENFTEMDWADSVIALRAYTDKMIRQGEQPKPEFVEALTKHAFHALCFDEDVVTVNTLPLGTGLSILKRANPDIVDDGKFRQEFFYLRVKADIVDSQEMDQHLLARFTKGGLLRRVKYEDVFNRKIVACMGEDIKDIMDNLPESFTRFYKEEIQEFIDQSYDPEAMAYYLKIISSKELLEMGPEAYISAARKLSRKNNLKEFCCINPANLKLLNNPRLVERIFSDLEDGTKTFLFLLQDKEEINGDILSGIVELSFEEDRLSNHLIRQVSQGHFGGVNEIFKRWLDLFEGIDTNDVSRGVDIVLDSDFFGYVPELMLHIGNEVDHNHVAKKLIDIGDNGLYELASHLENFSGLGSWVAEEILDKRHSSAGMVAKNIDCFVDLPEELIERLASHNGVDILSLIEDLEGYTMPSTLKIALDMFGDNISTGSYSVVMGIMNGGLSSELLKGLGVNQVGKDGLNQLSQSLRRFADPIFKSGEISAEAIENPLIFDYLKGIVRFKVKGPGTWGERTDQELRRILSLPEQPLGVEYEYGEISVAKARLVDFKIPKDSMEELESYLSIFIDLYGKSAFDDEQALFSEESLQEINLKIRNRQSELQTGIEAIEVKIAKDEATERDVDSLQALKMQQKVVSKLSIKDEKDVLENLATLAKYKENHDFLRKVLIGKAMRSSETSSVTNFILNFYKKPSFETIPKVKDFVGHQIIQEALAKSMSKNDIKIVKKLLSTKALDHAISLHRQKQVASSNTTTFGLFPARGALMELSGHIGDICWASKYESIAQEHPNVTAVAMVKNPGKSNQKFAGASFLIETESIDGEKLLVIRGLNPLQTEINMLNQESFVNNFTDYARKIANASGRKLAIVIDDHVGGSATNRPQLFEYLSELKRKLEQIRIPEEGTTINDYDISDVTYRI